MFERKCYSIQALILDVEKEDAKLAFYKNIFVYYNRYRRNGGGKIYYHHCCVYTLQNLKVLYYSHEKVYTYRRRSRLCTFFQLNLLQK